jgi:hypothetical protein
VGENFAAASSADLKLEPNAMLCAMVDSAKVISLKAAHVKYSCSTDGHATPPPPEWVTA